MSPDAGWAGYEKLVMDKLTMLERDVQAIDDKLVMLRIDVAQLKIKAGIWGATAGLIPGLVTAILALTQGSL